MKIIYGPGVPPLIHTLQLHMVEIECQSRRKTLQVWYADDSDLEYTFARIKSWFAYLIGIWPTIGYHPEPAKSFLVTSPGKIELVTSFFSEESFKI